VVYAATGPVSAIPLSALAGVLMVTAFRMVSIGTIRMIVCSTRSDALTFILTAFVTVCFDLIEAVEIGIVIAAFFALRTVARRSSVAREELPGPHQPGDEKIALLRLDGAMFFGAAERISHAITDAEHPEVSVVIIRMSQLGMLDATGAHTLAEITHELEARGITVIVKGVQAEHLNLLARMGIFDALRHENHLIDSLENAVAHARTHSA
jgi:SulP family sulfate permease